MNYSQCMSQNTIRKLAVLLFISSFCFFSSPVALAQMGKSLLDVKSGQSAQQSKKRLFVSDLLFAQTSDVWSTVSDVKRAKGNLSAVNNILESKYGRPEEAFSSFNFELQIPVASDLILRPGLSAEAVAYAVVQNPVVPELNGTALAAGIGHFGLTKVWHRTALTGTIYAGLGFEKRMHAVSTDLIERIPVQNGKLQIYALEVEAQTVVPIGRNIETRWLARFREAAFVSSAPRSKLDGEEGNTVLVHRWRGKGTALYKGFGVEGIVGPQPVPLDLLPIAWDYARRTYAWPELGAMVGAGGVIEIFTSNRVSADFRAGFYGGYIGGGMNVKYGDVTLSVGSWGLENSAAYQVLGSRVWQASLSVAL